jgi:hypothetical protein
VIGIASALLLWPLLLPFLNHFVAEFVCRFSACCPGGAHGWLICSPLLSALCPLPSAAVLRLVNTSFQAAVGYGIYLIFQSEQKRSQFFYSHLMGIYALLLLYRELSVLWLHVSDALMLLCVFRLWSAELKKEAKSQKKEKKGSTKKA